MTVGEVIQGCAFRPAIFRMNREKRVEETEIPDSQYYMELGYNRVPGDRCKHYRHFIGEELEDSHFYGMTPFEVFELKKGQSRGLTEEIKPRSNERVTGLFKGLVRITPRQR